MKHANEQKALWKPFSNPVRLLILCPQKTKLRVSYRKQKDHNYLNSLDCDELWQHYHLKFSILGYNLQEIAVLASLF